MRVKVTTVDTELEFETPQNNTGQQLYQLISRNVAMNETSFFGIFFKDSEGDKIWIEDSKKILSRFKKELALKYRVKYFPEDVQGEIIEDITVRYFFLEVRSSILSDELYCPPDTCVLLASYACQARHGNYAKTSHQRGFLANEKLVPDRIINQHKTGNEFWEENIINMWKKHNGMLKEEAMMEYLKLCQNLEMFGVHYFPISNSKGSKVLLGVYAMGLNIYKKDDKMNPITTFPWSEIKNINFKDRKFTIKPVDKTAKNFVFFVQDPKTNKRILKLGIGYHQQYVRKRQPESMEITQMRAKAEGRRRIIAEHRKNLQEEKLAREEAERREANYQKEIVALKQEAFHANQKYMEAQEIIRSLRTKLEELEQAKNELEAQQGFLQQMMERLQQSKDMEAEEKLKLENEIRKKQAEVQRIRNEVNAKDEETRRLQEKVEQARLKEEEFKAKQLAEAARSEEEKLKELSVVHEIIPELTAVNAGLREELKVLKDKLEKSRDETKETEMDKIHRKNVRDGRDKYQTLAAVRKGNTTRRVDLFENL